MSGQVNNTSKLWKQILCKKRIFIIWGYKVKKEKRKNRNVCGQEFPCKGEVIVEGKSCEHVVCFASDIIEWVIWQDSCF